MTFLRDGDWIFSDQIPTDWFPIIRIQSLLIFVGIRSFLYLVLFRYLSKIIISIIIVSTKMPLRIPTDWISSNQIKTRYKNDLIPTKIINDQIPIIGIYSAGIWSLRIMSMSVKNNDNARILTMNLLYYNDNTSSSAIQHASIFFTFFTIISKVIIIWISYK